MGSKQFRDGQIAYFWRPPRRVEREELPIHFEARVLSPLVNNCPMRQIGELMQWAYVTRPDARAAV
jgi:hypothetical protein